jgi:hypothetical protein
MSPYLDFMGDVFATYKKGTCFLAITRRTTRLCVGTVVDSDCNVKLEVLCHVHSLCENV